MQANTFYCHDNDGIPLHLISNLAWQEGVELTPYEKKIVQNAQFTGDLGSHCLIPDEQGNLLKVFVGTGKDQDLPALAFAAATLPPRHYVLLKALSDYTLLVWSLTQYRFQRYKQRSFSPRVLCLEANLIKKLTPVADAIFLVRDLINTPANDMAPQHLAEISAHLAQKYHAKFEQWVGEDLLKANFPAIYTVGCASAHSPRLLSLTWGESHHPCVALVGKGVCFDSGGLDIKSTEGMRLMKKDMGGAAHVLGLAQWIMSQKLKLRLIVLIPAVENAIDGRSFRPGDVITMRNGLTVEVDNTDAEGRLVLADAMVKACEEKPELIIDFATLTGAARAAVGTEIAAMFTNNHQLSAAIMELSKIVQEAIWPLPLHEGYEGMLDSKIADLANGTSSPYAGAITAALFLQRFLSQKTDWIHFDIMAWNTSTKPGKPEGGEAMALRTIMHYLQQRYGS